MSSLKDVREKVGSFELKKSWMYYLYVALLLPSLLFLLGFLFRGGGMGVTFARLYHTYNLFVSSPIPHLPLNGSGILGFLLLAGFCIWAARRRDYRDLALTLLLGGCNAAFFLLEYNYLPLRFLTLSASPF